MSGRSNRRPPIGWRRVFAIAAVFGVVAACADQQTNDQGDGSRGGAGKTIRILVSAPLTGDYAETGEDLVNGAKLAVDHVNGRGGVSAGPMKGAQLSIETADDQVSTEAAATIASRYTDDSEIWALTGMISSGQVQAAAKVAERAGLVVYSTFSCADFLTTESDNVLVICTRLQSLGAAALDFAATEFKATKISVFVPNFSFEEDIMKGAMDHAATLGVTVTRQNYPFDQADFSALITNIEKAEPDVVAEADFQANAGRIVSQLKAAGLTKPVVDFLCEGWADTFYKVAGAAATGVYACESAPRSYPAGTLGAQMLKKWDDTYDRRMTSPAVHAFDSILAIEATISAGAAARTDLLELLPKINGGEGLLGPIKYEGLRPVERPLAMLKVTGTSADAVEEVARYTLFADGGVKRVK